MGLLVWSGNEIDLKRSERETDESLRGGRRGGRRERGRERGREKEEERADGEGVREWRKGGS